MLKYRSLSAFLPFGSLKGRSLDITTHTGLYKGKSLLIETMAGLTKVKSDVVDTLVGYSVLEWTYSPNTKQAIGTLTYPLYMNAKFSLEATNGVTNTDFDKIINPQTVEYLTLT